MNFESITLIVKFIHMDNYPTTKFILERVKTYLNFRCIILFDQIQKNFGRENHEDKALMEVFDKKDSSI